MMFTYRCGTHKYDDIAWWRMYASVNWVIIGSGYGESRQWIKSGNGMYRKTSSISRTKSQNLNDSCIL